MDPVLLALINGIKNNVNTQINSVVSGIEDYDVDGLNLVVKLKDGTERIIEFEQPKMEDVALQPDAEDKVHLTVTLNDGTIVDAGIIPSGLSAYDIAVANGYVGTEAEWLATLPGRRDPVRFDFPAQQDWNIQHNMNDKYARITLFDTDDDEIMNPVIERVSPNLAIAHFDVEVAGYAIVS